MLSVTTTQRFTVYGEHALKPPLAGVVEGVLSWVR
jgi:hypothetical protein